MSEKICTLKNGTKVWIEYSYPNPEDAAIVGTWINNKPDKKDIDNLECVFEYEIVNGKADNEKKCDWL